MNTIIDGVDYGPLAGLIGTWKGDKGMDIAPEPDGTEENPFYETILFEAIGDVTNAESQLLAAVRYHQVVCRKSDDKVFHNETGYWMWDAKTDTIMHSFTIPRGVCVIAGGKSSIKDSATVLDVQAAVDNKEWGIIQSPFMRDNAKTNEFYHNITIEGDVLSYFETTVLDIYGKTFEHTDGNTLSRSN